MSSVYFDPAVGGNGTTVTDDSSATTGLGNGGHRTRFVPALAQVVAVAGNAVGSAQAAAGSAAVAAANAITALNAPGTQATSTSSLAVGLGSKSLTLAQTGKAFVVGQYVQIVNSTSAWMVGLITAFTPATGAMTVNVTNTGGSGTLASWTVTPTNPPELPSQSGNSGKALVTNGAVESWDFFDTVVRSARTANTSIGLADKRKLIDITSGTFTQTFDAAATLGDGWWCYIKNSGTGDITLDPNGSETIDGLTSFVMYPGEVRLVQCDGSALRSVVLNAFYRTFTASGNFITPPGYSQFSGLLWGGGGSGGKVGSSGYGGGGGGGACVPIDFPASSLPASVAVTIAASATGATGNVGTQGNNSSFGGLVFSYGGGGGYAASSGYSGGGGGGALSAGSLQTPGLPYLTPNGIAANTHNSGFGGGYGGGGSGTTLTPGTSVWGGGGGGHNGAAPGGSSVYGGGGGGGAYSSGAQGGVSTFGGNGGAGGGSTTSGGDGIAPGGGGGGTYNGTKAGDGARGELRIWGVI